MRTERKRKQTQVYLEAKAHQLKKIQKENDKEVKPSLFTSLKSYFDLGEKCFTTEDTLPFEKMYENGICQLSDGYFTKMLSFEDINYQLALEEQRDYIFNQFASFLNSFDANTRLQFCFTNQLGRLDELEDAITIPSKEDDLEEIRLEFRAMLQIQLEKGNNGLRQGKYIIFGVKEDSYRQAKIVLSRLEIDLQAHLKGIGIRSHLLNGTERLVVLHHILNPSKQLSKLPENVEETDCRSLVVPDKMYFQKQYYSMDDILCRSSHFQILASELSDRFLTELLSLEENMVLSLHIQALDQVEAIKLVKRKFTDVQRMTMEEQKKAYRSGYDLDIIPSDLMTYGTDLKHLLTDLQSRDEKMFLVSFVILNQATLKSKLDNTVSQLSTICSRHNCVLRCLDYQQEQGLITALPLGINQLKIKRQLTTSSTAVFIPFTTEELFMTSNTSIYYGLNAISHNLIMADRKQLKNPNGLILGTPGSGKSFSAKREISNAILITDDDILICDPEGEYGPLVQAFGGEVIQVSAKSNDYLNPLDINMNYGDGDAPLKDKANFIMSLLELVVGGSGLTAAEKSVIDRCLPKIYEGYFENPLPENMPILQDLYDLLLKQEESVGRKLATEMEIYVTGSLNVFNHRSTVDLNKSLLCFDIKELGTQLKKIGMLVIQDQVWNKVSQNRQSQKSTRYYIDEFHLLLKEEQTAQYSVEIWKRFRKWGGIPTGLTQNVKDLLASKEIENVFDNTDFIMMLNQAPGDREILARKLKISPYQLNYVTNSNAGEGLLFFGNTIVPFIDQFPKNTLLYQKMTTKPEEVEKG